MSVRRKVLYLATLTAMIALFVLPATRWVVVQQIRMLVGAAGSPLPGSWENNDPPSMEGIRAAAWQQDARQSRTARANPSNFQYQLGDALQTQGYGTEQISRGGSDTVVTRERTQLRNLKHRWDNAIVDATLLRFLSRNPILKFREKEAREEQESPANLAAYARNRTRDAETIQEWLTLAQSGARKEPANAFFPLMEAVALYAQKKDDLALAAMARASHCATFNDYATDELRARWALREATYGPMFSMQRIAILASVLLPHWSEIRRASQLTTHKAVLLERAGRTEAGLNLRLHVFGGGQRIVSDSNCLAIGNLVGIAMQRNAFDQPGGAAPIPHKFGNPVQNSKEQKQKRIAKSVAYLRRIGHDETAHDFEKSVAVNERIGTLIREGLQKHDVWNPTHLMAQAVALTTTLAILGNALTLLLLAGVAARIKRQTNALTQAFLAGFGLLAIQIGTYCAVSNGASGVMYALHVPVAHFLIVAAVVQLIPLCLIVGLWWASKKADVPRVLGVARGVAGLAPLIACTMLLLYAAAIEPIAHWDTAQRVEVEQMLAHETRYLAEKMGEDWPMR